MKRERGIGDELTCLPFLLTSGVSLAGDVALEELLELLQLRSRFWRPLALLLLPFMDRGARSPWSTSDVSFREDWSITIWGPPLPDVASLYFVKLSSCNIKILLMTQMQFLRRKFVYWITKKSLKFP